VADEVQEVALAVQRRLADRIDGFIKELREECEADEVPIGAVGLVIGFKVEGRDFGHLTTWGDTLRVFHLLWNAAQGVGTGNRVEVDRG